MKNELSPALKGLTSASAKMRLGTVLACAVAAAALSTCGSGSSAYEDMSKSVQLLAKAERETPLPPGSQFDDSKLRPQPGSHYQTGFFIEGVQAQAQCKWYMHWLAAYGAHDTSTMSASEAVFRDMRRWPLFTGTDEATRQMYDAIVQRAELGDVSALQQFVHLNCQGISP
ncbi:MAG: hypothetical protein ACREPA_08275 [Candidatus Dormibacteraceae bacterium]